MVCSCLVVPDNSVQSVVSFDQGGEWVPLRKPTNTKCDATARDPDKVKTVCVLGGQDNELF